MSRHMVWGAVLIALAILTVLGFWALLFPSPRSGSGVELPAERVADYVRAVVNANRAVYTTNVVEPLQAHGTIHATAQWKENKTLPLPDQILLDSGRLVTSDGLTYRLASLKPINHVNGATTDFERRGLEEVRRSPTQAFTGIISLGQKKYFQAIYADLATSQDCVSCHNQHQAEGDTPFKLGDVLGGLIVTLPVEG